MGAKPSGGIAREYLARGDATGWFEQVYARAGGDEANISWADLKPHILLRDWLDARRFGPQEALDIGCGLGDNAEALAAAGLQVTAIDIAPTAIAWARSRFSNSPVSYQAADLFDLPPSWQGRFQFINEIYTLQALPESVRQQAIDVISGLLAPGGTLLVVCRGRAPHQHSDGPPWALSEREIMRFETRGLKRQSFERFDAYDDSAWPRFRFTFTA